MSNLAFLRNLVFLSVKCFTCGWVRMCLCWIYLWQHKDFLMASFVAIFYTLTPAQTQSHFISTPRASGLVGVFQWEGAFGMAPQDEAVGV